MELGTLAIFITVSLVMSVFSGIAGSGAGFVTTPLLIVLGLSPAQAVSTGKVGGFFIAVGSLGGLRSENVKVNRGRVAVIMLLALGVGLGVPTAIRGLDNETYRVALGILILLMVPPMIIKKIGIKARRPGVRQRGLGLILLTIALALEGAFSGGLATLINIDLMGMLGMTAAEANLAKRWAQLVLNFTILAGIVASGLIVWPVALATIPTTLVGGYVGGKIGAQHGDRFIVNAMLALMVVSGLALITGFGT
jgi:uncharacterized membrane protein YfcA